MKKEILLGTGMVLSLGAVILGGGFTDALTPYKNVSQAVAYFPDHPGAALQVTGYVQAGTLVRAPDGLGAAFALTDSVRTLRVGYRGVIPDNFGVGQNVVVIGRAAGPDSISADQLLVKCPTKYEPDVPSGEE